MNTHHTDWYSRRAVLASTATGLAALAGCSSQSGTPTTAAEPVSLQAVSAENATRVGENLSVRVALEGADTTELSLSLGGVTRTLETTVDGEATVDTSIGTEGLDPGEYELGVSVGEQTRRHSILLVPATPASGLHGQVVGPTGTPVPDGTVEVLARAETTVEMGRTDVDAAGFFGLAHPVDPPADVTLTFRKAAFGVDDGLPALAHLLVREPVTSTAAVLGRLEVPQGHFTQVKLVDSAGSPVGHFDPVRIYSPIAMAGLGVDAFTTTAEGYLIATGAEQSGITLPGDEVYGVCVTACSSAAGHTELATINGQPDGTVTVEVPNPDQF